MNVISIQNSKKEYLVLIKERLIIELGEVAIILGLIYVGWMLIFELPKT